MGTESVSRKVRLNRDADEFHQAAAHRRGISISEWFRLIPFLLTKEEVTLIKEYRKSKGP